MHDSIPTTGNAAATDEPRSTTQRGPLEALLLAWQETADQQCFSGLVKTVAPLAQRIAGWALRRHGIPDPIAADEVLSLVLDHLRRLPGSQRGERTVAAFSPPPSHQRHSADDPGTAYVLRLTRDRAHDVARSRRRQARHTVLFSQLDRTGVVRLERSATARADIDTQALEVQCGRLRDAVTRLPPRERSVVELLLAGKSQATIANTLQVCEGTISRLRGKAIAALRDLLAD